MQKSKWILDGIAVLALLFVFLPDLTGFVLHEWIGIVIAVLLLVHIFQHWDWVKNTTQRFTSLKWKVLSRYLLNGLIGIGFLTITITGLVISSLLMLPLDHYEAWRFVHVIASYSTVLLLVVKLVLHWEMIAKAVNNVFQVNPQTMSPAQQSRRKFLRGAGVTAVASLIAVAEIKEWMRKTADSFEPIEETDPDIASAEPASTEEFIAPLVMTEETGENEALVEASAMEIGENIEPDNTPTAIPTLEPTAAPAATATEVVTGVVKCRKGCSYPGRCGRYCDSNQNGKCDLGEPIW